MTDHMLRVVMQKATTEEIAGAALALIEHGTGKDERQTLAVVAELAGALAVRYVPENEKLATLAKAFRAIDATREHLDAEDTAALLGVASALIDVAVMSERTR